MPEESKQNSYEELLAGTVALGYLDCTLLEYARGIKYFIDGESHKFNPDTHLINLLRRAACVGWENIRLFHAPIEGKESKPVSEDGAAVAAAREIAFRINGGENSDLSYPAALSNLLKDPSIANETTFCDWLAAIISKHCTTPAAPSAGLEEPNA